jgi:hypothetical protein
MRFRNILFLAIFFLSCNVSAQNGAIDFQTPVNHTMKLSGTFGELRSNHFHSGIDIKGGVGDPILAIEDGYVSRIKVNGGGYGKVLYITHPNGYTSVYAHLNEFEKSIGDFIKDYQYRNEIFALELKPDPERFVFKKGDQIGKMGMTGHAFGPHLHFEIRKTASSKPVNPLSMGMEVADDRSPRMHEIRVFELTENHETINAFSRDLYRGKNSKIYKIKGDTVFVRSNKVGLALKAYDHMTGVSNWNGLYSASMFVNDSLVFEFEMEEFAFDETRYINAHMDYEDQVTKKSYFNRCYQMPGNQLSIYKNVKEEGILVIEEGKAERIKMIAKDVKGNSAITEFWVVKSRLPNRIHEPIHNYFLPFDEENVVDNGSMHFHMPKETLYENLYLSFDATAEDSDDIYSSYYHIHDYKTPVHKYYDLSIFPYKLPEALKSKAFIAYCMPEAKVVNYGGEWDGKMLKTKVRDLGDFTVMVDTIPPTIKSYRFKRNMQGWESMIFVIEDNFKTAGSAKGLSWYATIDDQWVLMELDAKKNRLIYTFDGGISRGKHKLKLTVWDGMKNKKVIEKDFVN